MNLEVFLWAWGAIIPPLIGAHFYLVYAARKLIDMHENPERTGFGTVGFEELLKRNTAVIARNADAIDDLRHVVEWIMEHTEGDIPRAPPRIRKPERP